MTTAAARKIRAKRARRPIYGTWMHAAILETGESRLGFFADHPIDRQLLKERGFRKNSDCRAMFEQKRAYGQHKLIHKIGTLLVEHVEEFRDIKSHDAVKRVQRLSGVCCDIVEMDASPVVSALLDAAEIVLGAGARKLLAAVLPEIKTINVKVPQSLAFDEMEQSDFETLFKGLTQYIGDHYASVMLDEVRAEFWKMANEERDQ